MAASVLIMIKNQRSIKTCEALVICKTNGRKMPSTKAAAQYRHFILSKKLNVLFKLIPPVKTIKVYCQFYLISVKTEIAVKKYNGAVSARKIRGPKPTLTKPASVKVPISEVERPPSGPKRASASSFGRILVI